MKKILLAICLSSGWAFGQTTTSNLTVKPVVTAESVQNETIEHCDAVINAIDVKVSHVMNDDQERAKAEANGWFDKMARNRAIYVARKEYLINHPNNQ